MVWPLGLAYRALQADTDGGLSVGRMGVAMLTDALAGLASSGGTALVTAMATDGWKDLKPRFARLLGRGKAKRTEIAAARLEQSRTVLAWLSGPALARARAEQEIIWRTRLGDMLEEHPGTEKVLRSLVAEVQAQLVGSVGPVQSVGPVVQQMVPRADESYVFGNRVDGSRLDHAYQGKREPDHRTSE